MHVTQSLSELLASQPEAQRKKILATLTDEQARELQWDWGFWGRPEQQLPSGDWFVWLIMAGRGWGKTRTAVENIAKMVRGSTPLTAPKGAPKIMSFIADTPFDMRQYSIEGPSGFLNVGPREWRPTHEPSKRMLIWPNGCRAMLFSAEDPEATRGASGSFFWWDELAKARYAREGWTNMLFGMREGNPRGIVTTTPRPIPLIKELKAKASTRLTIGSTWDNRSNLSDVFYEEVIKPVEGTRLGRQEVNAEILDDVPGALWTRANLDDNRLSRLPCAMQRIVVAIDPSGTKGTGDKDDGDDIGIIVAGKGVDGRGYVLADRTCNMSPAGWGRRAVEAYHEFGADCIIAERNFGGAMVAHVINTIDKKLPFKEVVASRGKVQRAEPVAALYEKNQISHISPVGAQSNHLAQLEDQLCLFSPSGYMGDGSPDRADANVWALTELFLGNQFQYGMLEVA